MIIERSNLFPLVLLAAFGIGVVNRTCTAWAAEVSQHTTTADAAWSEIEKLGLVGPSEASLPQTATRAERARWFEARTLTLREKGLAFFDAYPADPRRWRLVFQMQYRVPRFITSFGPNIEKDFDDVVVDATAASAWKVQLAALVAAMDIASDLPADVRERIDGMTVAMASRAAVARAHQQAPVDWSAVFSSVRAFAAKYPDSDVKGYATQPMYTFEMTHSPEEIKAVWADFAESRNESLSKAARQKLTFLILQETPLALSATALDGREVDLAKLRGKVVLIDFWATWCGPCRAEMPNVRKVYEAYHDKGFEIIGVSCDVAPDPAKPTTYPPKTGDQVLAFTRENAMPWPEIYEGKKMGAGGNVLAARFAVTGIPAAFLIDRDGKLAAMNVRGPRLEAEVKRLLSP